MLYNIIWYKLCNIVLMTWATDIVVQGCKWKNTFLFYAGKLYFMRQIIKYIILKCLKSSHKRSMRKIRTFRNFLTRSIDSHNNVTCTLTIVLLLLIFLFCCDITYLLCGDPQEQHRSAIRILCIFCILRRREICKRVWHVPALNACVKIIDEESCGHFVAAGTKY